MSLTIREILTHDVLTVSQDLSLAEAAALMAEKRISCLVATEQKKPVGILTEADLVHIGRLHVDMRRTAVARYLSQPVISNATDQSIYEAFDFLLEHRVRLLVVVDDDGCMQGLLTFSDILKATEFDDFLVTKPIADVMSRNVVTLKPSDGVEQALALMDERHISCVVVVDEHGKAVGMFSERDAARLLASDEDVSSLSMRDVMSTPLITMHEDESLLEASQLMRRHRFRRMVIVDDAGKPIGILTQFDVIRGLEGKRIQELKKCYAEAEAALSETRKLLAEKAEMERIVDISPVVLYRCEWDDESEQFIATWVSSSITTLFGYERHECLAPGWWREHVHPDDWSKVENSNQQLLEQLELKHSYRFADKQGEYHWVNDHVRLTLDNDGSPQEMVGSWQDITERKQVEEALSETNARLVDVFESMSDGFVAFDANMNYTYVNGQGGKILGRKPEYLVGKNYWQEYPEAKGTPFANAYERVLKTGIPMVFEDYYEPFGRWFENRVYPTKEGLSIFFTEITERKQAEEALRASEASFRGAMEASFDGMVVHRDGRILFANAAAVRLIGAGDEAELLGKPVLDFLHPDYREVALSRLQRLARDGKPQPPIVERYLRLDGGYIDIEATSTLFQFKGEPAVLTVGRDVTERKQAEAFEADQRKILEMIADSEAGLSEVLEEIVLTAQRQRPGMLGSVLLMDADGKHMRHGAAPDLPQAYNDAIDGGEIGPNAGSCGTAAFTGERVIVSDIATDPLWADYKELAASFGLAACWSEPIISHGKVLGTFAMYYREPKAPDAGDIAIIERITALAENAISHKQAESELKAMNQQMDHLVRNTPAVIYSCQVEAPFAINYISPNVYGQTGYTQQDFLEDDHFWASRIHPDDQERIFAELPQLFEQHHHSHEYRFQFADGSWHWMYDELVLQHDDQGKPREIFGYWIDITDRKQAERAYREEAERNELILQSSMDGVIIADDKGDIVQVNPAYCEMVGYSEKELTAMNIVQLEAMLTPEQVGEKIAQMMQDGVARFESQHRHKDGHVVDLDVSIFVMQPEGEKPLVSAFVRDITERKEMETHLKEARARHNLAQRIARLGHWDLDHTTGTLRWSEEVYRIFEVDKSRFSASYEAFLDTVHPDDREMVNAAYQQSLRDRSPYSVEHRLLMPDGRVKWVLEHCETEYSEDGAPILSLGTVQDITDQKAEQEKREHLTKAIRKLSQQLLEVQETERKSLAQTLHDDIGQTLTAIKMHAESISRICDTQNIQHATRSADEIRELANGLIQTVRGQLRKLRPGYVIELGLKGALDHLCEEWQDNKAFACRTSVSAWVDDLPEALQVQLFRIAQEALTNVARHASASEVKVSIRKCKGGMEVDIRDNGCGFDPDRPADGMGLLGIRERATVYGGQVQLQSSPKQGTHLRVRIPFAFDSEARGNDKEQENP